MSNLDFSTAVGLAIEKANAQMKTRGDTRWSIEDDRTYRYELARVTGEPVTVKPWDSKTPG